MTETLASAPLLHPVEWRVTDALVPYPEALAAMEARVGDILAGRAPELVWLLEHPPLYTAGTSANPADLLEPDRFPVYPARRGGEYTYHGPGQRVAYAMLDLDRRGRRELRGEQAAKHVSLQGHAESETSVRRVRVGLGLCQTSLEWFVVLSLALS